MIQFNKIFIQLENQGIGHHYLLVTVFLCQIGIFNTGDHDNAYDGDVDGGDCMTMIIVIFNPVVNNTPNESNGLTALEVWVLSNIGLVFLAFLAYALLLAQMRLQPSSDVAPQKNQMSPTKDQNAK